MNIFKNQDDKGQTFKMSWCDFGKEVNVKEDHQVIRFHFCLTLFLLHGCPTVQHKIPLL